MSRLSIFSSETLDLKARRVVLPVALTLVFFFLIDAMVRWIDPLNLYGGWENPHVQYKLDFARRLKKERGRIDVILFSSSIGLQTDVSKWEDATGNAVVCYNAAIGGQKPQFARFLFENVYYPEVSPSHVIYCISPRDVNSGGHPGSALRHHGPLWQSFQIRRRLASTALERAVTSLEGASYLFQARHHIRRYIQKGPIPQDTIVVTQRNGVDLPAVRQVLADHYTPAQKQKERNNAYSSFTMPDDGEMQELVLFSRFCRLNGVEFVVVNQPVAPITHELFDHPESDYQAYLDGLARLRKAGVQVVEMADQLQLGNRDFGDNDHPNRKGAYAIAGYLYKQVLCAWFPDKVRIPVLPEPAEINLSNQLRVDNLDFYLTTRFRGLVASPLQAVTQKEGARLTIEHPIPPGEYLLELYGADERTTPTSKGKGHRLSLEITSPSSTATTVAFEMSRALVQGAPMTRLPLKLDSATTLTLSVVKLHGPECILDSIFLTPLCAADCRVNADFAAPFKNAGSATRNYVRNGSFEFPDVGNPDYPAEWSPYTRERPPWGKVGLVNDAHDGKAAVQIKWEKEKMGGWGCLIAQDVASHQLDELRGKTIDVTVWAKSGGQQVYAAVHGVPSDSKQDLSAYSAIGDWQKLRTTMTVPTNIVRLYLQLGALGPEPVIFDGIEVVRCAAEPQL